MPFEEERTADEDAGEDKTTVRRSSETQRSHLAKLGLDDIEERWGFGIEKSRLPEDTLPATTAHRAKNASKALPAQVSWRSLAHFADLVDAWQPIYERDGLPVLIERRYPGGGAIVLATDRYFLSNEGLREDRASALLVWILARHPEVIFDETHLGTARPTFIMTLLRRYRLQGVLAAFGLVALLYIWKNATSLVPRRPLGEMERVQGSGGARDGAAGLVSLLRRTVPQAALLKVSIAEWRHSAPRNESTPETTRALETVVDGDGGGEEGILARYREICTLLAQRHGGGVRQPRP
jgi:hypothetical protein